MRSGERSGRRLCGFQGSEEVGGSWQEARRRNYTFPVSVSIDTIKVLL